MNSILPPDPEWPQVSTCLDQQAAPSFTYLHLPPASCSKTTAHEPALELTRADRRGYKRSTCLRRCSVDRQLSQRKDIILLVFGILRIMGPRPMAVHPVHGYKIKPQEDIKTIKRNQRERNRVQTVNSGFDTLKQHLPGTAHLKKVSKVTILTHAMEYIAYLTRVLHNQQSQPMVFSEFSQQRAMSQQHQMVASNQDSDVQLMNYSRRPTNATSDFYSDSDQMPSPHHPMQSPMTPMPHPSMMHQHHASMHSPAHSMQHSPAIHSPAIHPQAMQMLSPSTPSPSPGPQAPLSPPSRQSLPYPGASQSSWQPSNIHQHIPCSNSGGPPPLVSSTTSSSSYDEVSSGEEDDILDAIAEWQQVA